MPLEKQFRIPLLPAESLAVVGYTMRSLPVQTTTYSGQRLVQTYMTSVQVVMVGGQWMQALSDMHARVEGSNQGRLPYQAYHIYTTTFSSPDGAEPYKAGDVLVPNGNLVGTVSGTFTIRGVQPYPPYYIELMLEKKL